MYYKTGVEKSVCNELQKVAAELLSFDSHIHKSAVKVIFLLPIYNFEVGSIFSVSLHKPRFMEHPSIEPSNDNTSKTNKTKTGLTPRELIHYHINNPHEPISDEDIENLILTTNSAATNEDTPINATEGAADNRMLSDKDIEQLKDHSITTPYDILGGK